MATSEGFIRSASVVRRRRAMFGANSWRARFRGLRIVGVDHAHAHARPAPQLGGELVRQADAAVRGGVARQDALVHGHARPVMRCMKGTARRCRYGAVVSVLDDAEDAGRRGNPPCPWSRACL
jgi:hypothetical protein